MTSACILQIAVILRSSLSLCVLNKDTVMFSINVVASTIMANSLSDKSAKLLCEIAVKYHAMSRPRCSDVEKPRNLVSITTR